MATTFINPPDLVKPIGFNHGAIGTGRLLFIAGQIGSDKEGKMVVNPQFDLAAPFSENLACVRAGKKFGYVSKTGKLMIDAQFEAGEPFSGGLARVRAGKVEAYIDKTGKFVWKPAK